MILANEALGVILSLLYVLVVVLSVEIYFRKKACTNKETFRKIIHILISNYIIIVCYFNTVYYFAMIPSSIFIFVNILSNKFRIIKSMERKTKNYCGTIWYALSVTMVVIFSFTIGCKYIALASVLVLGYGDGIAALIGSKFGKHYLPNSSKTLEGTCSMFCISLIIISSISYLATGDIDLKVILSGCIFATISEALITRGFDNLFIPLIISGVLWINQEIPNIETIIFMESLMVLIAFGAWYKNALSLSASILTFVMMSVIYIFAGVTALIAVLFFFIPSSIISTSNNIYKKSAKRLHKREGTRTYIQVIANGGVGIILSIVYYFTNLESVWVGIFVSLAVASSDTWSSEIGMLSSHSPISLLTLKKIKAGLSGGVTMLGLLGSVVGAVIVAVTVIPVLPKLFCYVTLWGIIGSLIDSLMGGVFQVKYINSKGELTEREYENGAALTPYCGVKYINNDSVNFLSILMTSCLAIVLY